MTLRAGEADLVEQALASAAAGRGRVEPNPCVGAVVARDGAVIGRGAHLVYGGPHAEVAALADAGPRARGATVVVTLEPCSTAGKTPACTDALIRAGVARVVYAAVDPNLRHAGRAAAILGAAGIEVEGPVAESAAAPLLERFRGHLASERPFVVAKWAMTLDGRVATTAGESRWITSEAARARVHELRGTADGIAVGRGTVERDDPELTARPPGPRRPFRIAFDRELRVPRSWRALRDGGAPVLLVHAAGAGAPARAEFDELGVERIEVAGERTDALFAAAALAALRARGVERLLVEGGPRLLGALLDARAIDRVHAFVGPAVFGGVGAPPAILGAGRAAIGDALAFEAGGWEILGPDALFSGFVCR